MKRGAVRPTRKRRGRRPWAHAGITLVELLVVLALLGLLGAVASFAAREGLGGKQGEEDPGAAAVFSARARALTTGKPVTLVVRSESATAVITALPDGRLIGADRLGFDPLAGRRRQPLADDSAVVPSRYLEPGR